MVQSSFDKKPILPKVSELLEALNRSGVRYCHWKSNVALAEALTGLTDIDLLVDRRGANTFRAVLAEASFRPAVNPDGSSFPGTEHYFALDSGTGALVHVHAYFRVITGESLAKTLHLPLEDMLLDNSVLEGGVPVPTKAAELVVFTIRMMMKHTTLVELALLARDWGGLRREALALVDTDSIAGAVQLVKEWLPTLDSSLFTDCAAAVRAPAPLITRVRLGRRLRSTLRGYARHSRARAAWIGFSSFASMLARRAARRPARLVMRSGGAVVAVVGPEATGKSTLISEINRWLGEHFVVERVHAGKPPSTPLTFPLNAMAPLLRRATPAMRPSELEATHAPVGGDKPANWVYPLTFAIRAVLLAYDRRALLTRAYARAANGTVVLCDRYPYVAPGSPDGPRLVHYAITRDRYPLRARLADLERRLYQQIPPPDLVISLRAPVEVAIARNRTRGKHEPEAYIRRRHSAAVSVVVDKALVYAIDTNREIDMTLRAAKEAVWSVL